MNPVGLQHLQQPTEVGDGQYSQTILVGGLEDHLDAYRIDQEQAAAKLLKVGESSADPDLQMDEVAAYLAVASVILNLDETITRQ